MSVHFYNGIDVITRPRHVVCSLFTDTSKFVTFALSAAVGNAPDLVVSKRVVVLERDTRYSGSGPIFLADSPLEEPCISHKTSENVFQDDPSHHLRVPLVQIQQ